MYKSHKIDKIPHEYKLKTVWNTRNGWRVARFNIIYIIQEGDQVDRMDGCADERKDMQRI